MDHLNITTDILDVHEARRRLPEVKEHLAALVQTTELIRVFQDRHGDRARLSDEERDERDRLQEEWKDHLLALNGKGAYLKDATTGLVDFYTWIDDELAFLCYRHGEETITTWHGLDEDSSGRKNLPSTPAAGNPDLP